MPQILTIYSYYVRNTTISFLIHPPDLDFITSKYNEALHLGLPYLVAIQSDTEQRKVLGYIHAGPFNASKLGYAPSLELTLYVDPGYLAAGIGGALLRELITQLTGRVYYPFEKGHEESREGVKVRNLYSIVSEDVAPVDSEGGTEGWKAKGQNTIAWYKSKFGFEEEGRLRKVGTKFGRW